MKMQKELAKPMILSQAFKYVNKDLETQIKAIKGILNRTG